jgi:hypothetical protein
MVGDCGGVAILLIDEASGFAEVYGINNKNDLVDALSRYCQGVVARDMQPHFARFDAGSEVTRHGELTGISFKPVRTNLITILPSAPGIRRPTRRRGWQNSCACNMFLQQENLIKQQWLAVLFAAVVG